MWGVRMRGMLSSRWDIVKILCPVLRPPPVQESKPAAYMIMSMPRPMARACDPRVEGLELELADGELNCNVLVDVHHGGDAKEIGPLEL